MVGVAALGSLAAHAQTDVAASLYGAFNEGTSSLEARQSQADAAGGLLEVRHIKNPLIGYEATYSVNRANQTYKQIVYPPCPAPPGTCVIGQPAAVSANAHEFTGDWVASFKVARFKPFALAGGGILVNVPSGGQLTTITSPCSNLCATVGTTTTTSISGNTSTKPVFVYGAGVDWKVLPHIGLRLQYRGNLYNAPGLTDMSPSTGALTHTSEPMIGVFFRL